MELLKKDWSENLSVQSSGVSGVTTNAPITTIPPTYNWAFNYTKNPTTTGLQIITIVAPSAVNGTPEIKLKQMGQSDYSFVTPIDFVLHKNKRTLSSLSRVSTTFLFSV